MKIDIDRLIHDANELCKKHENMRFGQALMLSLRQTDKQLCDSIQTTNADCFHDNSKIKHFISRLCEEE